MQMRGSLLIGRKMLSSFLFFNVRRGWRHVRRWRCRWRCLAPCSLVWRWVDKLANAPGNWTGQRIPVNWSNLGRTGYSGDEGNQARSGMGVSWRSRSSISPLAWDTLLHFSKAPIHLRAIVNHALLLLDSFSKARWLLFTTTFELAIEDLVAIGQNILVQRASLESGCDMMRWIGASSCWLGRRMYKADTHHGSLQDCTDVSWPVTRKGTAQQGEELLHGDALALVLFGFIFFLNVVGSIGSAAIFGQLDVVVATMAGLILFCCHKGLQICQVKFFTAWIIKWRLLHEPARLDGENCLKTLPFATQLGYGGQAERHGSDPWPTS